MSEFRAGMGLAYADDMTCPFCRGLMARSGDVSDADGICMGYRFQCVDCGRCDTVPTPYGLDCIRRDEEEHDRAVAEQDEGIRQRMAVQRGREQ